MMRITREDEHYIGRARPALHSRVKVGFRQGRPHHGARRASSWPTTVRTTPVGDGAVGRRHISLAYQPKAMRWRGARRADQHAAARRAARARAACRASRSWSRSSPKAARKLGIDEVEIHRINAPAGKAPFGAPNARGQQQLRHERVREGSARQGRRALQLGGEEGAQRQAGRLEGARRRRGGQHLLGRLDRLRRPAHHQARRPGPDPVGHRQPRHALR